MPGRKPVSDFKGAIWEPDEPFSCNKQAEMALCHLALSVPDLLAAEGALAKVEPLDFAYDDTRFVFTEVQRMQSGGKPVTDPAAQAAWFKLPEVCQRMREAKLDWLDEMGEPVPHKFLCAMFMDGQFATMANLDWYVQEVRKWRLTRGVRRIAWDLSREIDEAPDRPLAALAWLKERVEAISVLAESVPPKEAK